MQSEIKASTQTLDSLKEEKLPEQVFKTVQAKMEEEAKTKVEAIQGTYYETYD